MEDWKTQPSQGCSNVGDLGPLHPIDVVGASAEDGKGKLPTDDGVQKLGLSLASKYSCCSGSSQEETVPHFLSQGILASSIWTHFEVRMGIPTGETFRGRRCRWLDSSDRQTCQVLAAAVIWVIWKNWK
ncbi:uncharacterized protein M6B38_264370 [Iris pallida]|uniref:Uncharacterized protein n=1 Tax=Iris pallida TaxID=29817 RepID=A0AAX6ICG0_IRIPA|nr:uncharacterized protein M6B38_264370 [Iris pallida]